jgi:hypothetical protein
MIRHTTLVVFYVQKENISYFVLIKNGYKKNKYQYKQLKINE